MAIRIVRPSFGVCQSSGTARLAHFVRGGSSSSAGQVTYANFGVKFAAVLELGAALAGNNPSSKAVTAEVTNAEMIRVR
jgi:hypothetical protein